MRTALVKTSFESIHRVGCHHIFRQGIPKVHYLVTQKVSSYCRFTVSLHQFQTMSTGCDSSVGLVER